MDNYFTKKQLRAFRIPVSSNDGIKLAFYSGEQSLVESNSVNVKDISLTGLGFSTHKELQIGQKLELKLEFSDYLNLIDGVVVRCQEVDGHFLIGVVFNFEEGETFDTFFQKFIKCFSSKRMKRQLIELIKAQNHSSTLAPDLVILNEIQSEMVSFGNSSLYFESLLLQFREKVEVEHLDVFILNRENGKFQHINHQKSSKEYFDLNGSILDQILRDRLTLNAYIISDELLASKTFIHNYSNEYVICEPVSDVSGELMGFVLASRTGQNNKYSEIEISLVKLFSFEVSRLLGLHQVHMSFDSIKYLNPKKPREFAMIGESINVQAMRKFISQTKNNCDSIWIKGDPGAGRKLLAKIIHGEGEQGQMNFKQFNGEVSTHVNNLEYVSSSNRLPLDYKDIGTFYISHFDKLDDSLQVKLLEFAVENKDIFRLIICTTLDVSLNIDVEKYFKNNMVVVPSLNERKNDIPMLVNFFIKNECKKKGLLSKTISQNILDKFKDHDWEGNIRELKTVVSRLVSWYSSKIYVDSLPPASYQIFESPDDLEIERSQYLDEIKKYKGLYSETELLSLINWGIVVDEMKKHDNNLKKTALALGKPHEMIVEYFERGEALLFRMKTKKVA